MHKLAIFVEGYSELIFVEKLISEIAGEHDVFISSRQSRGGGRSGAPKSIVVLTAEKPLTTERFYVLILDCGSDRQVVTKIREEHENLTKDGYYKIIGLRDLRPDYQITDIPRLMSPMGFKFGLKGANIPVHYILAVAEVEAWFLAEYTHYQRIHPNLTLERVIQELGFDPSQDNLEDRELPQSDLSNVYQLEGIKYQKGNPDTVNALDFAELYLNTSLRFPFLKSFIDCLDNFLTLDSSPTE